MSTINYRFRVRRGLASAWTANNPTLLQGEFGLETDTGRFKIGDGSTAWNSLLYCIPGSVDLTGLSDGDVLAWDASNAKFSPVSQGGAGGGFDPETQFRIYDDFTNGFGTSTATGTAYVTTRGPIVYTGNSGSASLGTSASAPGYLTLSTGSASASGYARACSTAGNLITLGGGEIRLRQRIRIPTLSTPTQRFLVQCGLLNGISGATSHLRVYYGDNFNSGQWVLDSLVSGTTTTVNTTIAPTANTWITVELVINAGATSCSAFFDGVLGATITAIPTDAMALWTYMLKSVGTTERTCDVDYHWLQQELTTAR